MIDFVKHPPISHGRGFTAGRNDDGICWFAIRNAWLRSILKLRLIVLGTLITMLWPKSSYI